MNLESEDNEVIFEFVREYLEFNGYDKTLAQLDTQLKTKPAPKSVAPTSPHAPKLNKIFDAENLFVEEKESPIEGKLKELTRQHSSVL
jgi:hypothetical protein